MEILTYGKGERLRVCSSVVAEGCRGDSRIIILPIPTTKDGVTVFGTELSLSEVCGQVESGTLVAGYGIPENMAEMIAERGGYIYDALLDEELVCENAQLTALGTLGWILSNMRSSPKELFFGIVGYGRIGKRLLRLLLFLGARVRVYSSNLSEIRGLIETGIEAVDHRSGADFSDLDVLINTAPARIVGSRQIEKCRGIRVIDLASGNQLSDIEGVVCLPSVPEKCFPESAGRLYAEGILGHAGRASEGE